MKLVSKIEIKTYATNIKELYIGSSKDNILHLINLFKNYDDDYYIGELYFNYEQNYSIYFKVITTHNGSNHVNPLECETETFELGNYQSRYKLEINEKKVPFVSLISNSYFCEYTIRQMRFNEK